jgi:hypothetical protein
MQCLLAYFTVIKNHKRQYYNSKNNGKEMQAFLFNQLFS